MRKKFLFCLIILTSILISGCNLNQPITNSPPSTNQITNSNQPQETSITYLVPTADPIKYCNGADMDSDGFRKTITKQVTKTIPQINISLSQLANKTLELAAQEANITFPQSTTDPTTYIKVIGDTAYVQPTEGWAGVSIFLCYWKPFVEVNLLQIPDIKKVEWTNDYNVWNNLK